ncbi:acyl carrier protein 1 [Quercus suber]|uniref:Acyl carrier protein n=1 Tax=Quercus suber TaxID=58331 RepID=A0AAW0L2J6_QUESU
MGKESAKRLLTYVEDLMLNTPPEILLEPSGMVISNSRVCLICNSSVLSENSIVMSPNYSHRILANVTPDVHFQKDLGLDSLDNVEIVMALEEEFKLEIPDKEADKIDSCNLAIEYIYNHPMAVQGNDPISISLSHSSIPITLRGPFKLDNVDGSYSTCLEKRVATNAQTIIAEERRREETGDGDRVVDPVNQVMGRYIKSCSEDALSSIQGFELPMIRDTLLPTENHIPTITEQLANIDFGITRFEVTKGRNARLGLELSHYQLDEVGSQGSTRLRFSASI